MFRPWRPQPSNGWPKPGPAASTPQLGGSFYADTLHPNSYYRHLLPDPLATTFRIALQPGYRGRYTVNPAKAELMYFPTKFGRSTSKQAVVE